MSESKKKSFIQTLKEHETAIVETAAVLTASTRWIITFSPIDKTNLKEIISSMGRGWDIISAILSVSFAVVEIWATAMIMRAFNLSKGWKDKLFLGGVWLVSLIVLALVQIPPLYASLMDVPVSSLDGWNALYVVATSVAAFIVIAGVSYADRFKAPVHEEEESGEGETGLLSEDNPFRQGLASDDELQKRVEELTGTTEIPTQYPSLYDLGVTEEELREHSQEVNRLLGRDGETLNPEAPKTDTRIVVNGYEDFLEKASGMNGKTPRTGSQIEKTFKVSHNTAYKWARKLSEKENA